MAHFYGSIKGSRGEATRCGADHYRALAQGWQGGIDVYLQRDYEGVDHFSVFITGGGNGYGRVLLATGVLDYRLLAKGEANILLDDDLCTKYSEIRAREIMTEGVPDYAKPQGDSTEHVEDRAAACPACDQMAGSRGGTAPA